MAGYSLLVKPSAAAELDSMGSKRDRQRVVARIAALATHPRPPGSEKLAGTTDGYRVRQRDYRVVYAIDDGKRSVTIVRVGRRRDVYRKTR